MCCAALVVGVRRWLHCLHHHFTFIRLTKDALVRELLHNADALAVAVRWCGDQRYEGQPAQGEEGNENEPSTGQ